MFTLPRRGSFNTASGMRSHVTPLGSWDEKIPGGFQYRKRYEVTCDAQSQCLLVAGQWRFQYRKRYEVTCDLEVALYSNSLISCFNTASGMRSHVTDRKGNKQAVYYDVSIPQAV